MPPSPLAQEYEEQARRIRMTGFFSRLARKTQVYSPLTSPHPRMRMTHTLDVVDVTQRIICGVFDRSPDALGAVGDGLADGTMGPAPSELCAQLWLGTAIALGHDLGHTPFGHAGELGLSQAMTDAGLPAFHHNWQSLRVVERVEKHAEQWVSSPSARRRGMRLSPEVLDGILNHTRRPDHGKPVSPLFLRSDFQTDGLALVATGVPSTAAGLVVAVADEIAQRASDLTDALRSEAITVEDVRRACGVEIGAFGALPRHERSPTPQGPASRRHYLYNMRLALESELLRRYVDAVCELWSDGKQVARLARRIRDAHDLPKSEYRSEMRHLLGSMGEVDRRLASLVACKLHDSQPVLEANHSGASIVRGVASKCFEKPELALDWYYELYKWDLAGRRVDEARLNIVDYVAAMTDDHVSERHRKVVLGLEG